MRVLKNFKEYMVWIASEYACDIFSPEEMAALISDLEPPKYPCIIYELPEESALELRRIMFISLDEIEAWCDMLRSPER